MKDPLVPDPSSACAPVHDCAPSHPVLRLGVEQEFELFDGSTKLDFRELFPSALARVSSVPFRDRDTAVIIDAGYMLACDEKEAEIATGPIDVDRDGCLTLAAEVCRCRNHMVGLLGQIGIRTVRGYSTHLNINAPSDSVYNLTALAAITIGPALVLLLESANSPGLLIRPRRGRLEIGSEYVDQTERLAAAAVLLAGAQSAFLTPGHACRWPRVKLESWQAGTMRGGLFLPHDAYGESIHARGRAARLTLAGGKTISAGQVLASCAELALDELNGRVAAPVRDTLRHLVKQRGSLQVERSTFDSHVTYRPVRTPLPPSARTLRALASLSRSSAVTPRFVDWEGAAFALNRDVAPIVGVPWNEIPRFLELADKGNVTPLVNNAPPQSRLETLDQLSSPRVYAQVDAAALGDQAFHDIGKADAPSGKSSGATGKRRVGKKRRVPLSPAVPTPTNIPMTRRGRQFWFPVLLIPLLVIIFGGLATLRLGGLTGQKHSDPTPSAPPLPALVSLPLQPLVVPSPTSSFTPSSTSTWTPSPTPPSTGTLTLSPTATSSRTPTRTVTATITATRTHTPTSTLAPCIPGPIAIDPPDGRSFAAKSTLLRWQSDYILKSGEMFEVLVWPGGSTEQQSIGTTTEKILGVDFNLWNYGMTYGRYDWTVRIKRADGTWVSCETRPLSFILQPPSEPVPPVKRDPPPPPPPTPPCIKAC